MTTITYTEQGVIIDGHAENPVACHGISAISQMVANFAEERGWAEVAISDGHLEIRKVSDEHCGDRKHTCRTDCKAVCKRGHGAAVCILLVFQSALQPGGEPENI